MRTSFNIPERLIDEARQAIGSRTKTQAIVLALTEMIQRRRSRKVLELKGSLSDRHDYKKLRRKR